MRAAATTTAVCIPGGEQLHLQPIARALLAKRRRGIEAITKGEAEPRSPAANDGHRAVLPAYSADEHVECGRKGGAAIELDVLIGVGRENQ